MSQPSDQPNAKSSVEQITAALCEAMRIGDSDVVRTENTCLAAALISCGVTIVPSESLPDRVILVSRDIYDEASRMLQDGIDVATARSQQRELWKSFNRTGWVCATNQPKTKAT